MHSLGSIYDVSGRRYPQQGRIWLAFALCFCLALSACVGVTPLPKRVRTAQGETNNIDLSQLKAGQTTLGDVRSALYPVDTGFESDRYFLGRWNSSTWGGWAFLCGYGGGCLGPAGARHWGITNFLARFDDAGRLVTYSLFPDERLLENIALLAAERKGKNPSSTTEMSVQCMHRCSQGYCWSDASLTLSPDSFALRDLGPQPKKKDRSFSVPAQQFLRPTKGIPRIPADPIFTTVVLHFAENRTTAVGPHERALTLRVTVPQAIILLAYAQDTAKAP